MSPHATRRLAAHPPLALAVGPLTAYQARAAELAAQDATRRAIVNAAPPLFSPDELLDLARAAEYMAAESEAADRQGRCAAYLYDLARKARAAIAAPVDHEGRTLTLASTCGHYALNVWYDGRCNSCHQRNLSGVGA